MNLKWLCLISLVVALIPMYDAEAANPNLSVSAENDAFGNRFAGSMVVEVVVHDPRLSDTHLAKGEPDVTVNGQSLRMTQASSGSWFAYFAHADAARAADATVGLAGEGLDFGVFCGRDTPEETFGVSFSDTDGFAVPRSGGLSGFADGTGSAGACTGEPGGANTNNVVRNSKSLNKNSAIPTGQTGLDPGAWPLIQLYTFRSVTVSYNPGGSSQQVQLEYDKIPDISLSTDREIYPSGAEVFVTISDAQLNQDPTDEDSWTFGPNSVFYHAYDDRGSASAAGGPGLANILPHLSGIGFADNGMLDVDLGSILEIRSNGYQPDLTVTDGSDVFSGIVTFVETSRNSGVFDATDTRNKSVLGIIEGSQRGQAGYLEYNGKKTGILTGSTTATFSTDATLSVGDAGALRPGTRNPVILHDPDQNLNSDRRDLLDVSDPASIIPTLKIGSPITLAGSTGAEFYVDGGAAAPAQVSVPDRHSERLFVDTSGISGSYDGLSIDTGTSAAQLVSILVDTSRPSYDGTNWLNYDIRSLAGLGGGLAGASVSLEFGGGSVLLAGPGLERQALVQLGPDTVSQIAGMSGAARLVIDMEVTIPGTGMLPLVADFVSLGMAGSRDVNNAIYRFELEETSRDSSTFEGTIEYSVANQINAFDPKFIGSMSPIDDRVRFIVTSGLTGKDGLFISYSDLDSVGVRTTISSQPEVSTHTGTVSSNSKSFRFGHTVVITVNDPDLNLRNDISDIYPAVNDPNSEIVDTVGRDGVILLEVLLKDVRYKRCVLGGVTHGGLGSAGFSLVETGPGTGIFEGSFKMPSQICNRDGTGLMSPAGGGLDVKYHDAQDSSGDARVASLTARSPAPAPAPAPAPVPRDVAPQLSSHDVTRPPPGDITEVTLSGRLGSHVPGVPLAVAITDPDGNMKSFESAIPGGKYKSIIAINENSLPGTYEVSLSHGGTQVGSVSFEVSIPGIPDWVKADARKWSSGLIPDDGFASGIRHLVESGLITPSDHEGENVPDWVKNGARWWADDLISDEDFVESIQYLVKKGIIRV